MTTRKTLGAVLAALSLSVLTACSGTDTTGAGHETMGSTNSSASSPASAEHNDADVVFAQQMIPHHSQAVEMAELVQGRTTNAEVIDLATRIKGAQDPEIQTMTTWLQAWGAPAPGTTAGSMPGMDHGSGGMPGMMTDQEMTDLRAAAGDAFDKHWLSLMVAHHEGAVEMARAELADGKNTGAKALAQKIIDAQEGEISEMHAQLPQG